MELLKMVLWIIIAIAFGFIYFKGNKVTSELLEKASKANNIGATTDTGHFVAVFGAKEAITALANVVKELARYSGYAALVSVVAAICSIIL